MVVADFNGDGYLDVFLPHYSMISPDDHSCLLLNDGEGHFTDGSDLTGFASEPDANVAPDGIPHFLDTGPRMYPSNCDPVTRAYYLRTITTPAPTGPFLRFAGAAYTATVQPGRHVTLRANGTFSVQ